MHKPEKTLGFVEFVAFTAMMMALAAMSTLISLLLGTFIGHSYNGTVFPLVGGFLVLSIAAFGVMRWVEAKKPSYQVSLSASIKPTCENARFLKVDSKTISGGGCHCGGRNLRKNPGWL
jgi:hypothetical protein